MASPPLAPMVGPPQPPAPAPAPAAPAHLPWSDEIRGQWIEEIARARRVREEVAQKYDWAGNLERYSPKPDRDDVNVMADFRDVERKKAALFYDTPTIALSAHPETPLELRGAITLHQRVLNTLLAASPAEAGVGAKPTVLRALFDVLCPAGIGVTRVGYGTTTIDVYPDPLTGQPSPDPIEGVVPVPVPIHERLFFAAESPKAILLPPALRSNDTDSGAWIGVEWRRPVSQVRAEFGKPEDWMPGASAPEPYFTETGAEGRSTKAQGADPEVAGCTVYFKAALFPHTGVKHPEIIGVLEMAEGDDGPPLKYERLAWQTLDPQTGQLTPDSFRGFPVDPLFVRDLTDTPWVASDCAVTAALTKEENRGRTIQQEVRKANRAFFLYDPTELPEDEREAARTGSVGTWVPVNPGALRSAGGAAGIIQQASQLSPARANLEWAEVVVRNRELALGISANQQGGQGARKQTATESSIVQRNTDARFEQERQRVLAWYLRQARKLDSLLHRYGGAVVAQLVGPQAAQAWAQSHMQVLGWHTYTIQMDSGRYVDIESNRGQKLKLLNLIGRAPNVNPTPIIADIVQDFGYNPQQVIITEPPAPKPEPPKLTISAEMLNPGLPQFDIILEIMRATGYQISDDAVNKARAKAEIQAALVPPMAEADTPVATPAPQIPGTLPTMPTLNQKQMDRTGALPGPGPE